MSPLLMQPFLHLYAAGCLNTAYYFFYLPDESANLAKNHIFGPPRGI
jgi:hypothetical protein